MKDYFSKIYNEEKLNIYRYALYKLRDSSEAEDITSDVFLRFYKNLENNPQIRNYYKAWLYTVARNLIIDYGVKSKRHIPIGELECNRKVDDNSNDNREIKELSTEDRALEKLIMLEESDAVKATLAEIPGEDREIIELRVIEGLRFKEIAVILNIKNEATVKMRYHRAIAKTRTKLKVLNNE